MESQSALTKKSESHLDNLTDKLVGSNSELQNLVERLISVGHKLNNTSVPESDQKGISEGNNFGDGTLSKFDYALRNYSTSIKVLREQVEKFEQIV